MSVAESNEDRRINKYARLENTDFIPYKVACRIRDFITFSVKLSARAPDLKFPKYTDGMEVPEQSLLDQFDEEEKQNLADYKAKRQEWEDSKKLWHEGEY
jgi:hypothetical protein